MKDKIRGCRIVMDESRYKVASFLNKNGEDCTPRKATILVAVCQESNMSIPFSATKLKDFKLKLGDEFLLYETYQKLI